MTKRFFVVAAASAAMAMVMGANASAADVGTVTSASKTPGVSFVDRAGNRGMRDVVVEAGIDPSVLEIRFTGAQRVSFENVGTLQIVSKDGSVWRYKPTVYQMVDGKRKLMNFGFHFVGRDRVTLKVDKLNPAAPLVVGPVGGHVPNS